MTTLKLAELVRRSIFPAGVFNVIGGHGEPAGRDAGHAPGRRHGLADRLARDRQVDRARRPSDTLKRVHLELGGKAPVVVFDDVDMETAMETIAGTGYYNAGQDCTAATRVLAAEGRLRRRRQRPRRAGQGPGRSATPPTDDTTLGPLNSERQRERVEGFLERKPRRRRDRHRRQASRTCPGFFLEPTVVAGLEQDDEMIQNEIFGPVITVQPFATRRRRSSGRTAPATASPPRSGPATSAARMRVAKALRFGCVWVNDHIPIASEMPHGGYKQSGYGKDLSMYSLEDYTEVKHVMINLG